MAAAAEESRVEQASYAALSGVSGERQTFEGTLSESPPEGLVPYETWTEQHVAADALGRIGPPAIPHLVQALKHPDPSVRKAAAEVLARMGSDAKEAVPDLVKLLDDDDFAVRKVAARTLGRIGPAAAAAVPSLMRSLVQPSPAVPASVPPALP